MPTQHVMVRASALLGLAFCLIVAVVPVRAAPTIRIAVASNFKPAMQALLDTFRSGQHNLQPVYGATGKLYAQIRQGAPFAAFLAADTHTPERLEHEGRSITGSRFTYAIGQIALWSPDPDQVDASGAVLASSRFRHLALANPRLAPYGRAARAVLQARGLWETLQPRLVRGENIAQTWQFVASGAAELGFVAWSQLVSAGRPGSYWLPDPTLYPPIAQQAVLLDKQPVADAFLKFMQSAAGRTLIASKGYRLP